METITFEAIPLRVVAYGDRDLIVTWLGRGVGQVSTFARGVRNSKSRKFIGGIELFRRYRISAQQRQSGSLWSLVESEVAEDLPRLCGNLERMSCGACALELVRLMLKESEPEDGLMDALWRMLRTLQALDEWPLMVLSLRWFEMQVLSLLGLAPQLERCVRTGRPTNEIETLGFSVRSGGVIGWESAVGDDGVERMSRRMVVGLQRLLVTVDLPVLLERALVRQQQDESAGEDLRRFLREAEGIIWGLIRRQVPDAAPKSYAFLADLIAEPPTEISDIKKQSREQPI